MASAPAALAGAPLYAGALNLAAGAAIGAAAGAASSVVRRSLGGGGPGPDAGAAVATSVLPGGLGVAKVRQIFERPQPVPIERQYVVKGAVRDGGAIASMQRQHDLAGGSAPHLDFRSLNGMNDGYGPIDRRTRAQLIGPDQIVQPHAPALNAGAAAQPNARKGRDIVMASFASSSDDRPPPGPARPRCGASMPPRQNCLPPERPMPRRWRRTSKPRSPPTRPPWPQSRAKAASARRLVATGGRCPSATKAEKTERLQEAPMNRTGGCATRR